MSLSPALREIRRGYLMKLERIRQEQVDAMAAESGVALPEGCVWSGRWDGSALVSIMAVPFPGLPLVDGIEDLP